MEDGERTKISCGRFLLLLSQGVIMGIGAVLPGISGGVLCVIFGIYQPMMETLAHPKKGIKKYGHMVLPVVLGFLGGFVLLAGAIAKLASSEPAIVTSLFVGLIVGTLPQLFRDGAKQGRDKSCYIALAASTLLLTRLLYAAQVRHGAAHNPQCRVVLLLRRSVGHKHGGAGNDIVVGADAAWAVLSYV